MITMNAGVFMLLLIATFIVGAIVGEKSGRR